MQISAYSRAPQAVTTNILDVSPRKHVTDALTS
jgi:hypothetical protein